MRVVPSDRPAMVKPTQPSVDMPDARGKNDKFKRNLLRKRRTYAQYFDKSLHLVDLALARVAVFRGSYGERVVPETAVGRHGEISFTGETTRVSHASSESLSLMKRAVAGVVDQKEKNALEKYGLRCVERRSGLQRRRDKRLLNWELTQKKREKEERDWNFKLTLRELEHYLAQGGRPLGRNERWQTIPIYGPVGYRMVNLVVVGPTRDNVAAPSSWYFDGSGRRIRFGSRRSVLG